MDSILYFITKREDTDYFSNGGLEINSYISSPEYKSNVHMKKYIFSILLPFALLALQSCDLKDSFKETLYDNSIEGDFWYADDYITITL